MSDPGSDLGIPEGTLGPSTRRRAAGSSHPACWVNWQQALVLFRELRSDPCPLGEAELAQPGASLCWPSSALQRPRPIGTQPAFLTGAIGPEMGFPGGVGIPFQDKVEPGREPSGEGGACRHTLGACQTWVLHRLAGTAPETPGRRRRVCPQLQPCLGDPPWGSSLPCPCHRGRPVSSVTMHCRQQEGQALEFDAACP